MQEKTDDQIISEALKDEETESLENTKHPLEELTPEQKQDKIDEEERLKWEQKQDIPRWYNPEAIELSDLEID